MSKKKNPGSDDFFGDLEDSFFASGEDDAFWDDDTMDAYQASAALPEKERQALVAALGEEDAPKGETQAPAAPVADAEPVAPVVDAEPAAAPAEPIAEAEAEAEAAPAEAAVAEDDQIAAPSFVPAPPAEPDGPELPESFRMAPPPPAAPAPAPTRPPDSALFSAPTLILPAGGMVDEEDLDGESEVAAATAAAPDDHLDAPTEEAPREPMTPPTPLGSLDTADRSAPDADVSAVDSGAETLVDPPDHANEADENDAGDAADAEADFFGAPMDAAADAVSDEHEAIAVGGAEDADEEDVAAQMVGEVLTRANAGDEPSGTPSGPTGRGGPELESVVMDRGYETSDEEGAPAVEAEQQPSPPAAPSPLEIVHLPSIAPGAGDAAPAAPDDAGFLGEVPEPTEVMDTAAVLDAPTVEAPRPGPAPALAAPPPVASASTPTPVRYRGSEDAQALWAEAAVALEREAAVVDDVAAKGALFAAAGHIRFRHLGEWEAAEAHFAQAREAGVTTAGLLRANADAAASRGDFELMRALLSERANLSQDAAASEALHDVALVERNSLREPDAAASTLGRAIDLDAEDWFALRLLQEVQHRQGAWAGLASTLEQMATIAWTGERARLLLQRGRVLADELGENAAAIEAWATALEAQPGSTAAFLALERGYLTAGADEERAALYEAEARRCGGADGAFLAARAARVARRGQLPDERVAALFTLAMEMDGSPELRREEQAWFAQTGRWAELAESLQSEAGATEGPAAALALYRLATVQEQHLGDPSGALASYRAVLEADAAAGPAADGVARVLDQLGEHRELVDFLAARLDAMDDANLVVTSLYRMGELCEGRLDDPEGARQWFERILQTAPGYLPALEGLERTYTALEAWNELSAIYEQRAGLAESATSSALFLHRAGSTWENRIGEPDRATELYRAALAAVPNFAPSLDALSRLLGAASAWSDLAQILATAADASEDVNEVVSLRYRSARVSADRVGDGDAAAVQLRMCLEMSPGFLPALSLLRTLALASSDMATAYQLHAQEAASTAAPDARNWRLLAAAMAAESVDGVDAEDVLAEILGQDSGHIGALTLRVDRSLQGGAPGAAASALRQLAAHAGDDAARTRVSALAASLAAADGDGDAVAAGLADAFSEPGVAPLGALARLAESFGRWEDALGAVALSEDPDLKEAARIRETWQDDPQATLAAWREALAAEPGSVDAASGVERSLSRLGIREGLPEAHEAIALGVEHPRVRAAHAVLAAHLYTSAEQEEETERCYQVAFDARQSRGRALDALIGLRGAQGDADGIRALLGQVDGAGDSDLADAFEAAGLDAAAAEALQALLASDGDDSAADLPTLVRYERSLAASADWRGLFDLLGRRRAVTSSEDERASIDGKRRWVLAEKLAETDEAWEFYRQLHEEAPQDAEVLESLARIAGARGETDLAVQYLEGLASVATDGEAGARYRRRVAEVHLRTGDHEAARSAFLAALDHQPEDLEALAGLKKLAEDAEDWRAMVGVLAREATVVEGEEQVIRYRAIASTWELKIAEPGVAMDAWRKVLDLRANDAEALTHLLDLARSREDWGSFVEFAQPRLAQLSGVERTQLQSEVGRVYFKKLYREDEAVRFLEAAVSGEQPDPDAAELLERIYAARGQWDLVVEANLNRARAAEGEERVRLLLKAAQTRSDTLHDRAGAAEIYGRVLEEDGSNAEALRFRGDWLYNSNDFEGAAEVFQKMEESDEERDLDDFDVRIEVALYYFRFAEALRQLDRTDDALQRFEQGLKLNPSHLPSLEAVGPLYMGQERWKKAGDVYRQILQLTGGQGDPARLARTYVNLGRVELHQGSLDKAQKRFNKALDLRANDIKALQGIAAVLFARKDWNKLLNVYNNIIYHAQEPAEVVDAYLTKGFVLDARLELPDKAQQHYEKSLAFDPAQPKALLRLAELALRKQDWPAAVSHADRGLAMAMDDRGAEAGLHLVRAVALAAAGDDDSASEAFGAALEADVTLTDTLGASLPEWSAMRDLLTERLQARL